MVWKIMIERAFTKRKLDEWRQGWGGESDPAD